MKQKDMDLKKRIREMVTEMIPLESGRNTMKRKRYTAMILAAVMMISGIMETVPVSAAEETGAAFVTGGSDELSAGELSDMELFPEPEKPDAFEEPDEETEEFTAEPEETEIFGSGDEEAGVSDSFGVSDASGTASYYGRYVTEAEFAAWTESGKLPENINTNPIQGTPEEFLAHLEGENTGYCLVGIQEGTQEGFAEWKIPQNLEVGVIANEPAMVSSITPGGCIDFACDINTPGTLNLQDGEGIVGFLGIEVKGEIIGNGSRDIVGFTDETRIGGMHGVETALLAGDCLEVTDGTVEFYDIIKEMNGNDMKLRIQGYGKERVPVFHKNFNFGEYIDDNGNSAGYEAGVCIYYVRDLAAQNREYINPGAGNPAVRFAVSDDSEIVDMIAKMGVFPGENAEKGYGIDIDGTALWYTQEQPLFMISKFTDTYGSVQDTFERYGKETEIRDDWGELICISGNLSNTMRIIQAVQSREQEPGYYLVNMPKNYVVQKTLTVPASVGGIEYSSYVDWNEKTGKGVYYPASVSSINVPAGKKIRLTSFRGTSGNLNMKGEGNVEFCYCRLNQTVRAASELTVELYETTVRSLTCNYLMCKNSSFVIGEYLKFNSFDLRDGIIIAKSGAYLNFGQIYSYYGNDGNVYLLQEVKGNKKGELYLSGNLDLGDFTDDKNETWPGNLCVYYYDYAKASAAGAPCTENCFNMNFSPWSSDGKKNPQKYPVKYDGKAVNLLSVPSKIAKSTVWEHLMFIYGNAVLMTRNAVYGGTTGITSDGKYLTANVKPQKPVNVSAYVKVNGSAKKSIAGASVSAIKDQNYTGKAIQPSVTVKIGSTVLKKQTDYTVAYKNNIKAGTASVTITGKGNYTGTVSKNFKIVYPVPAKGKTYTAGSLKYIVTKSAASGGTVSVTGPVKTTYTSVTIPSTVKINGYTFKVTAIASRAFKNNVKLKKIDVGANVTYIGKEAFYGCKALASVTIQTKALRTAGANALKGIYAKAVIRVPSGKGTAYRKLFKGKGQKSSVKIIEN